MSRALICHPQTPATSRLSINASASRIDNHLLLRFEIGGDVDSVKLPDLLANAFRADGLWHMTCCEAFVKSAGSTGYCEFNFAPSTAWAAYQFSAYREGMSDAHIDPPHFDIDQTGTSIVITVSTAMSSLADFSSDEPWQVCLSAVIEEIDGTKSYWALAHSPGAPDFHHPDCFALTLPAFARP
jgi:hypothetical protein